ncbi:ankyrin repeat domain-containing protein [Magnetospirillum sp. SS-4]|uniref:ankyrin repeat domain-containing protein n=1 Tax=Magnetospirillum sp. SS-4 TaxID=2681465 RepID=UPI00137DBF1B|nr:ankyrin repeat domain-containing protein [Magnetospirillum sp. SS-4]CAA7615479.1 exported hypothetical protein [Magnetospirillum sp. SS-4]
MRVIATVGLTARLATMALLVAVLGLDAHASPVHHTDARPDAASAPLRVLSRIQADMERVAAGASPRRLPPGTARDPLERLVDAVDALRRDRPLLLRDHVAAIRAEAMRRLPAESPLLAAAGSPERLPPLAGLIQAMRLADAALAGETSAISRLRLPCPLVTGRAAHFAEAVRHPETGTGAVLSCPVPESASRDFALMERLAGRPGGFADLPPPPSPSPPGHDDRPPPPPWDHAAAVRFMAQNPEGAETPLRLAMLESLTARLDLALFLHAYREPSPARDDEIRSLIGGVERAASPKASPAMLRLAGAITPYDGSDASLLPILRLAAYTRVADVASGDYRYPYPIPCGVLQRRPALAAARGHGAPPAEIDERPDFIPALSGCAAGRGKVDGFPEAAFAAFLDATAEADGGRGASRSKWPRYPMRIDDLERMERIILDPAALLAEPEPPLDHPYQTWAYGSLGNHAAAGRLRHLYQSALTALAAYYRSLGLAEAEAAAAGRRALFGAARGSACGAAPPPRSLRRLVMDGAPVAEIAAILDGDGVEDLKPFADCAVFAPFDPLLHVAAGHPAALALLWEAADTVSPEADREGLRHIRRIDAVNHFGKTALMAAAQAGRINSVRFLLDRGARPDADTWQETGDGRGLTHGSRTALMYGAANGSLPLIRMLVEAGADRFQADARGLRAVHYLLGLGPGPANPVLSPAERAEAARLLY